MRARSTLGRDWLREAFDAADPDSAIALLEPLCTEERRMRLHQVLAARLESVTVVMDSPHDPHNGAAIVRSCDAFGVQRLHVVERREPFAAAPAVSRGAERWVDVLHHADPAAAIASVRGFSLIAAHPLGELLPEQLAGVSRIALVLGNEHDGISAELLEACSGRVRVPMRGFVESLNVSVTAAILLAYATRGRPGDIDPAARRRIYARWLALSVPRSFDVLAARGAMPRTGG